LAENPALAAPGALCPQLARAHRPAPRFGLAQHRIDNRARQTLLLKVNDLPGVQGIAVPRILDVCDDGIVRHLGLGKLQDFGKRRKRAGLRSHPPARLPARLQRSLGWRQCWCHLGRTPWLRKKPRRQWQGLPKYCRKRLDFHICSVPCNTAIWPQLRQLSIAAFIEFEAPCSRIHRPRVPLFQCYCRTSGLMSCGGCIKLGEHHPHKICQYFAPQVLSFAASEPVSTPEGLCRRQFAQLKITQSYKPLTKTETNTQTK